MNQLKDKTAIVTGASSGIGEATALALAAEGANVVIAARREDRLLALERRIVEAGGKALSVVADVAEESQVQNLVQQCLVRFGQIDILVNNAGVMLNGPVGSVASDDFRRMTGINILGLVYGAQAVLPSMKESGGGHIVNVSSVAARIAGPGAAVYSATKAAVNTFSEALRKEVFKDKIRVTLIAPGVVDTELPSHIPDQTTRDNFTQWASAMRPLQSQDIANAILYAVSQPPHVSINEIVIRPTDQDR